MSVLEDRKKFEDLSISRLGYSIRAMQEDCNIRASWGYTVGLQIKERPACIYVRGPLERGVLDYLLAEACTRVKDTGVPVAPCHISEFMVKEKGKLRFKFMRQPSTFPDAVREKFNNYIEGQSEDTIYYWLLIADKNNILPNEKGYIDFKQVEDVVLPSDPVSDDILIEDFEKED